MIVVIFLSASLFLVSIFIGILQWSEKIRSVARATWLWYDTLIVSPITHWVFDTTYPMALWVYNNAQSALNFIYSGFQVTYLSILWWLVISVSILTFMFGSRALFFMIRRQIVNPPDVFKGIFEALVWWIREITFSTIGHVSDFHYFLWRKIRSMITAVSSSLFGAFRRK